MMIDLNTDQENILLLLRRIHFFDGLKFEELERLSSLVTLLTLEAGETIFRTGDPPEAFYIIERGRVKIIREADGAEEIVATLNRSGDFFGEMALIEARPRSATVRALTPCDLLVLARPDFEELIRENPAVHFEVTKALSHNLRRTDAHYIEKILEKNRLLAEAFNDLESAQAELLQRERLSMVGRLAAGIIHDLKKPLTCISGYAQLLAGGTGAKEKRQRYGEAILREIQRMVEMAEDIQHFARGDQEIKRRQVDFPAWLEGMLEAVQTECENSGILFEREVAYQGYLFFDPDKFRSVFFNILGQAQTAMPAGGKLKFACRPEGDNLRLEFSDTSAGMTEAARHRLLDDFFAPRREGGGIGLAIVKRIIEAHGGALEIESQLEQGTRYIINLPREAT